MEMVRQRARFDWLVELGGASAFAAGCAYAALKLAPSYGWNAQAETMATGLTCFAAALLMLRAAHGGPATHRLPEFAVEAVESDELLLNTPIEPLLLDSPIAPEELLLDTPVDQPLLLEDALPLPDPASRVVQLFASQPMPTPGQLKERIDQHLAGEAIAEARRQPPPDHASDALYAALDELRRSLR